MTKEQLIVALEKLEFPNDIKIYFVPPSSSVPYEITTIKDYRMESDDGYLQDPLAQCVESNVIVLSGIRVKDGRKS